MSLVDDNLVQILLVLGLALLAIEVLVLGFSTFMLFFVGLAAVATSALIYIGLVPSGLLAAVISSAVFTALFALLLWKPLSRLQNKVDRQPVQSDLVGHRFMLEQAVTPEQPGRYKYSGIDWKLVSSEALEKGTEVEVSKADVGTFYIKRHQIS